MIAAFAPVVPCRAAKNQSAVGGFLTHAGFRPVALHRAIGDDDHLAVAAKINGFPIRMVIATASPISVIDRVTAARFAVRKSGSDLGLNSSFGHSNTQRVGLAPKTPIEVANIVVADSVVGLLDARSLGQTIGKGAVGVLGEADLYRLAAVIDCGGDQLYLNPAGPNAQRSEMLGRVLAGRGFSRVPLHFNSRHHFEAECRFNGYAAPMTVETAALTCLQRKTAAKAGIGVSGASVLLEGPGGTQATALPARVQQMSVGPFVVSNAPVLVADSVFNLIGLDFLRKHSAVIDLGGKFLYLRNRAASHAEH
jgi:predicted aspartyl protease